MQSQPEDEKRVKEEEVPESRIAGDPYEAETFTQRNRKPARCYFMMMAVIYLMLLIVAVVVLASFEIKESEIRRLKDSLLLPAGDRGSTQTCILFAPHIEVAGRKGITALKPPGLCVFVLWGLISITIVAFVWLVYNVVLAAIGPKIISVLRFLDLVVMVLSALLSFSLSVTITAGINATCSKSGENKECAYLLYYKHEEDEIPDTLEYYKEINIAQWSSWATTLFLIAISAWYFFIVISYCCVVSHKRKVARQYERFDGENAKDMPSTV